MDDREVIRDAKPARAPMPKEACGNYEGKPGYGQYLDGNPCAYCRHPENSHTDAARKRWRAQTLIF